MQVLKLYSIYDNKLGAFMRPWCAETHGMATRLFASNVANPESMMHQYPEDYTLFYIGEFHEENGVLVSAKAENLGMAAQYLKRG